MHDGLKSLRLFIADDEPILLMTLEDILADLGCQVVASASSVAEGLKAVDQHDFQVAILDVALGTENIDPVAEAIAKKNIPIIFATGMLAPDVAYRFGPDVTIIEKPYAIEAIKAALQAAIT